MGRGDGKGSSGTFAEDQMIMYKECFKLMDVDKDGVINKNDLRAAFDNVGKAYIPCVNVGLYVMHFVMYFQVV